MKRIPRLCAAILCVFVLSASAQKQADLNQLPPHPRLLLLQDEEEIIRRAIKKNEVWSKMHEAILAESRNILQLPVLERIQVGRRLLGKSRECLRRVFYLSYAHRLTGEEQYFRRAEQEMLTVAKFSDWNPTHFLDVAEMTMGMAIGYDWLFPKLSDESRQAIADAILYKGLIPSLDKRYSSWQNATHNWNQVCNAGMTFGALAVADRYPGVASQIVDRALNTIHLPMEDYKPDGAYPEGYIYWDYGTSFNVMFLSAIEKAFPADFGFDDMPAFLKTAGFYQNMTGVTGLPFNWGDCSLNATLSPAMFWFADKNMEPSLLWVEKGYLRREDFSTFTRDRLLPAVMIWGKDITLDQVAPPASTVWTGQGANPVFLARTSWTDTSALYLGFKAGSASVNHGHMDIGSFVFESDGVRWAADFGMQNYESLESKGIQLFGRTQDAQRWTVFRLNNFVHNTLTINGKLQLVKGYAKIDRHSNDKDFTYAISDLSSVYENQLAEITRGVALVSEKYLLVQDELTTGDTLTTVRWTMLTPANVTITGKNSATLEKDGRKLFLRVESPSRILMKTWSTDPPQPYDAPNPGTTLVGFEVQLPPATKETLRVMLIPEGSQKHVKRKAVKLDAWK